jgi:ABC-type multidrug transport system fused ATPase/permease subunit
MTASATIERMVKLLISAANSPSVSRINRGILEARNIKLESQVYPLTLNNFDLKLNPGTTYAVVSDNILSSTALLGLFKGYIRPNRGVVTASGLDLRLISKFDKLRYLGILAKVCPCI